MALLLWRAGGFLAGCWIVLSATGAVAGGYPAPAATAAPEPALAADLCFDRSLDEAVPCEPDPIQGVWTGVYVGAHGGYGHSAWDGYEVSLYGRQIVRLDLSALSDAGALFGGQVGYSHQLVNNVVLGVEADFTRAVGFDTRLLFGHRDADRDHGVIEDYVAADLEWLASVRVRAGLAVGDVMPFATAGLGVGRFGLTFERFEDGALLDKAEYGQVTVGAVMGGGLEYLAGPSVIVRAEGLYYMFENTLEEGDAGAYWRFERVLTGRVAVNWRF